MSVIEIDLNTDIAEIHRPTGAIPLSVLIRGKSDVLKLYTNSYIDVMFNVDEKFVLRCEWFVTGGGTIHFHFNPTDQHTQREDIIHRLIQSTSLAMTWGQYE